MKSHITVQIITLLMLSCSRKEIKPILSITILSNQVYDINLYRNNEMYKKAIWDKSYANELFLNNIEKGKYKLNITDGINSKDTTFHYPTTSRLTIEMP